MSKKQRIILTLTIAVLVTGVVFSVISWSFTQQDLDSVRTELSSIQVTFVSEKNELSTTKYELLVAKNELQSTKAHLLDVEAELQAANDYLPNIEAELMATNDYLSNVEAELQATKTKLSDIQIDVFHLHNPTFEEVTNFLREDKTDSNKYVDDEYICSHFVRDVIDNADSQGIRSAIVLIRFTEEAHAIVAFDTIDEGMVYFDTITDERVRPVIGKEYWRCIEPRPGYCYAKPLYDDTIEDIVVVW